MKDEQEVIKRLNRLSEKRLSADEKNAMFQRIQNDFHEAPSKRRNRWFVWGAGATVVLITLVVLFSYRDALIGERVPPALSATETSFTGSGVSPIRNVSNEQIFPVVNSASDQSHIRTLFKATIKGHQGAIFDQADSVWRDGNWRNAKGKSGPRYVASSLNSGKGDRNLPRITVYNMNNSSGVIAKTTFIPPRRIGHLTIIEISNGGKVIHFLSSSGKSGTFNFETHEWHFSGGNKIPQLGSRSLGELVRSSIKQNGKNDKLYLVMYYKSKHDGRNVPGVRKYFSQEIRKQHAGVPTVLYGPSYIVIARGLFKPTIKDGIANTAIIAYTGDGRVEWRYFLNIDLSAFQSMETTLLKTGPVHELPTGPKQ